MQVARRRATGVILTLLVVTLTIQGCETNPATGEREFTLLSTEDQRQLGAQGDAQIVAQFGLYQDAEVEAMVERIGREVLAHANDDRFDYTFRVLDTEVINAFALPGGYIYVTRGLLAYLNNEAQLAMVLGHEVGHVAANHSAQQYTSQTLATLGLAVGGAVFEDLAPFLGAAQTGLQLLFLKYGRDDETQSDTLGVKYATLAGYEAAEGAEFFVTLSRLQDQAGGGIPTWASTHPDPDDREENILARAAEWEAAVSIELGGDDPATYMPRIDDIIFGVNPRSGFLENGTFYHPDLRFRFDPPTDWQVGNFATQVQMVEPNGAAAAVLTLSDQSGLDAAFQAFSSSSGVRVTESASRTVNGFPAIRARSNVAVEGGNLGLLSYFIAKDNVVYEFHGYSDANTFATYANRLEASFTSFRSETDPNILNRQPFRLNAFQTAQSGVFSSLVSVLTAAGMDLESLAILNQVESNQQIATGSYLKEVVR